MPEGGRFFAEAFAESMRPRPALKVSEWADRYRRLSGKGASEPGPWRTDRIPFLREIMDVLSIDHPAREVVFKKSTQVGGTEVGLNWLGYVIDHAPAPFLAVLPTVEVGIRWSKQRLSPMIAESPALRKRIAPTSSRDGGNTMTLKEFPGGIAIIGGANSAASLASMPMKFVLMDEVDKYPRDVGGEDGAGEGDPVDLAEARTTTFPRRKIFKISSPTIKSLSRIDKDWEQSDQRRYYVPCPECGHKQVLLREHLVVPEGHPEEAKFACTGCGVLIEEHHKTWMLEQGEWRPTFPERDIVGFHISAWYTPLGLGKTWGQHARKLQQVQSDPVRLKVFVNTVDGDCYADPSEKLDWQVLKDRAEAYGLRTVPKGVLVITAGVDVQGNRLAVQLVGWGREQRSWTLDWLEIPGDPTKEEVWEKLDEYLMRPLVNAFGVQLRVEAVGVDAGYLQDRVLHYTRVRRHRNVFALKGIDSASKTILSTATKPDKNRRGRTSKRSADLWLVSSSAAKEMLFLRMQNDGKLKVGEDRMVRFSQDLGEEYFTQLTAEIYDPRKRAWVKVQTRNEALDTMVYALAATYHPNLRLHTMREADWLRLEQIFEPQVRDLFTQSAVEAEPTTREEHPAQPEAPADRPASTEKPQRGGWIPPRRDWLNRR